MTEDLTEQPLAVAAYEALGRNYANQIENNAYNAHYERPATLSLLPGVSGAQVLDAGCGPGVYSDLLLQQGANVTACDVSPAMVRLAVERLGKRARVWLHDLSEPLHFVETASMDLVLCSLTLHYLRDWEPTLREFHRVLRDSGLVIFSTHHPMMDFPLSKSKKYFEVELIEETWNFFGDPVTVKFFRRPLDQMHQAIRNGGFVIDSLLEAFPTRKCEELFPADFAKLSQEPKFICFRLKKRPL